MEHFRLLIVDRVEQLVVDEQGILRPPERRKRTPRSGRAWPRAGSSVAPLQHLFLLGPLEGAAEDGDSLFRSRSVAME